MSYYRKYRYGAGESSCELYVLEDKSAKQEEVYYRLESVLHPGSFLGFAQEGNSIPPDKAGVRNASQIRVHVFEKHKPK
tara:strand:+ start:442 stop:678 length:237 start_codon:yes stop_codon:yes gene_type:complete